MKRPRATQRASSAFPPTRAVSPATEDLLDGLPLGVVLLDRAGTVQSVNTEGARLLGRPPDDSVGVSFPDIWRTLTGIDTSVTADIIRQVHLERKPRQRALVDIRHQHEVVYTV